MDGSIENCAEKNDYVEKLCEGMNLQEKNHARLGRSVENCCDRMEGYIHVASLCQKIEKKYSGKMYERIDSSAKKCLK